MWARLESNTIVEILTRPKALNIGDVKYPRNIFSMWTNAELAVIGIVPVTVDNTNFKNKEYYINTDMTYAYNTETGVATATLTATGLIPLALRVIVFAPVPVVGDTVIPAPATAIR